MKQTYATHFHSDNQVREDLNGRLEKEGRVERENWSIKHSFGRVEVIGYKQTALDLRERRHEIRYSLCTSPEKKEVILKQ